MRSPVQPLPLPQEETLHNLPWCRCHCKQCPSSLYRIHALGQRFPFFSIYVHRASIRFDSSIFASQLEQVNNSYVCLGLIGPRKCWCIRPNVGKLLCEWNVIRLLLLRTIWHVNIPSARSQLWSRPHHRYLVALAKPKISKSCKPITNGAYIHEIWRACWYNVH